MYTHIQAQHEHMTKRMHRYLADRGDFHLLQDLRLQSRECCSTVSCSRECVAVQLVAAASVLQYS